MPARKINYTAGQVDNSKSHGNYLSKHSDKEYETLLKAFLLLGEDYDRLKREHNDLMFNYDELLDENAMLDDELSEALDAGLEW